MRSLGTVFVRSYSLLFHPENVQNIRNSVENSKGNSGNSKENNEDLKGKNGISNGKNGDSKTPTESNTKANSSNPENDTNSSNSLEDKSVFCTHCGNRLGSFIDEKEPNFAIELLKDRIRFESKPFYSTIRRIFVELLDFYRWKYHSSLSDHSFRCRLYTKFRLQSKHHVLVVQLICPLLFIQIGDPSAQSIHQSLQFDLPSLDTPVDVQIEVQLMDLLALRQAINTCSSISSLESTSISSEIFTVERSADSSYYYFLFSSVSNKHSTPT